MSKFEGKTAVISGGAEGIGFSVASALAAEKMNIVLTDIDADSLANAVAELEQAGAAVMGIELDVADEGGWKSVAEQAVQRFGKVHMVVNNAGVSGETGPVELQQTKGWQWTLDVNLMGVVYGAKTMVPLIKQHGEGGWIVNVASMAGMGGVPYGGAYTATKTAVVGLSESWASELESDGIHVSVLCPAFVQTRIHESARNKQAAYESEEKNSNIANNMLAEKAKQLVENGIDVSIVGKRVVEALQAGELYIFTHPNYRPVTQHRANEIDAAFERAAQSPLLQHIVNRKIDML